MLIDLGTQYIGKLKFCKTELYYGSWPQDLGDHGWTQRAAEILFLSYIEISLCDLSYSFTLFFIFFYFQVTIVVVVDMQLIVYSSHMHIYA